IGQVLQNLLGNAVKYSPVGGDVSVRVARRGRRVQVDIVDHGFGIAPEDQRLIFGRFYRVGAVNGLPGLGLGLFISNMLVEAHGGRIWVESRRHAGSTFSFELPDGVDRPPPAEPPTARP
ncbi:MAG: sensor histidine kinase, partial [Thermomicrobiales bacterium]